VRRRWLTFRRPRWRGDRREHDGHGWDALDFFDPFDGPGLIVGLVVLVVLGLVFGVFVLPLLLFLGELLLLIPLALLGVVGRLLLRRPWTVQASCGSTVVRTHVSGWAASRHEMSRLAGEIRRGALT
jgi:hypothetical protein